MKKDNYKRQLQIFRKRASFYQQCEERMKDLEKRNVIQESEESFIVDEYAMLKNNNAYVKCVLLRIKEVYGSEASEIIAKNYVQGYSQKEISFAHHLSLRTMQRHMHKWLMEGLNQYDQ